MKFTFHAIKDLKHTGTVAPSSKFLINKMIKPIDFDTPQCIVEFGTGNGCVTQAILDSMNQESRLFSFEVNESFYERSLEKLPEDERLSILYHSALEFDEIMKQENISQVDYFISSLPLTLFKRKDVAILLEKVLAYLRPGGNYVQYQYSFANYKMLKQYFAKINLNFALINIPPAVVYTCSPSRRKLKTA